MLCSSTPARLFEKHKLIVATQLTFKILSKSGQLDERELEFLIQCKRSPNPPPMGERLAQFINESSWAAVQALIELPAFTALADDIQKFAPGWEKWCNEEKPEMVEPPIRYALFFNFLLCVVYVLCMCADANVVVIATVN